MEEKNDSEMKAKNADLRSQLSKETSELECIKLEHVELEKYNTIVKGELVQSKQQLEKLYTSNKNIEEQISVQRPSYDKTGLGFFLGKSTKKSIERKEPDTLEVKEDLGKTDDASKVKDNVTHSKKAKESNQDEVNKRKESHAWCDELEHTKDDCKGKSFKPISNFYCHNWTMDIEIMQ